MVKGNKYNEREKKSPLDRKKIHFARIETNVQIVHFKRVKKKLV